MRSDRLKPGAAPSQTSTLALDPTPKSGAKIEPTPAAQADGVAALPMGKEPDAAPAAHYTQAHPSLISGPAGAFFSIPRDPPTPGRSTPRIGVEQLDRLFETVAPELGERSVMLIAGVEVRDLERSPHRDQVKVLGAADDQAIIDALSANSGRRVLLLTRATFPEAFQSAIDDSAIVNVRELSLLGGKAFEVRPESAGKPGKPVFVETYAEFPAMLSLYLAKMEELRAHLIVLSSLADNPKKAALFAAAHGKLEQLLDRLEQRSIELPGLPPMNLEDLKMNLAGMIASARQHRDDGPGARAISDEISSLRRLLDQKHEFSLPVEGLSPATRHRIDRNNLVLATLETESRQRIIDDVKRAVAPVAEGVNVLGSAAWGAYYAVKPSSDVDLEVMIGERDLARFAQQLRNIDLEQLSPPRAADLLATLDGPLPSLIRRLASAELARGEGLGQQTAALLRQLGTFAKLHQLAKDARQLAIGRAAPLTDRMADYLAYKFDLAGVPVSIHFFPTETYARALELDLVGDPKTRVLSELRVGQRKKVSAKKPEAVLADQTVYPQKRSFDGQERNFSCEVLALSQQDTGIEIERPSDRARRGHSDESASFITGTPVAVFEDGRMYHGLFQDKAMWGDLETTSPRLIAARDQMLANLMRRFAHEVETGKTSTSEASIANLSARGDRLPAISRRNLLRQMRDRRPTDFARMRAAAERVGATELERLSILPSSEDPHDIQLGAERRAVIARRFEGEAGSVEALVQRIAAASQIQKIDARREKPDAEIIFMVKPLGMKAGVADKVRAFIQAQGGVIDAEWRGTIDPRRIAEHYARHADKPVFGDLVAYFTGQESAVFRVRIASSKIPEIRATLGSYKPVKGSLRDELVGDRWISLARQSGIVDNGLHISDSKEEGARESEVWFGLPKIVAGRKATQDAHHFLYGALSAIDPSLSFSGSQHNGLAISGKADDLDYRLFAEDVDRMAAQVAAIPGVSLRRQGIDHKTGARFLLFEHRFEGGKADIAVVPREGFKDRVSASVLAKFLPEEWKAEVREKKAQLRAPMERALAEHGHESPEYKAAKADYEAVKKEHYATVKRYFGISQKKGELAPIPSRPIPTAALENRLAELDRKEPGLAAQLRGALKMVPQAEQGALLSHVLAFEPPAPPSELAKPLAAAMEADARQGAALVERHRAGFMAYRAPFVPLKTELDSVIDSVAKDLGGAAVTTAIKGEQRGIARGVLKGTEDAPNYYQIKDMIRASVVMPTIAEAGRAIDETAKRYGGRIKIELDRTGVLVKVPKNRFSRPVGGYYDYMLKIDLGEGRQAEIQFHLPEMMAAKFLGKGHQTYDQMRALMRLFDDPQHGAEAKRYYARLDVAMRDYYGVAMEMARARTGDGAPMQLQTPYVDALIEARRQEPRASGTGG